MDPSKFYNNKEKRKINLENNGNRVMNKIKKKYSFTCRVDKIKWFSKLNLAIEYMQNNECKDLKLFSREKALDNEKRTIYEFVCAPIESFIEYYFSINIGNRHFYEIININTPCKLYFDLEYQIDKNPHLKCKNITKLFIKIVNIQLLK